MKKLSQAILVPFFRLVRSSSLATVALTLVALPTQVMGQTTYTHTAPAATTTDSWSTGTNWSGGVVPVSGTGGNSGFATQPTLAFAVTGGASANNTSTDNLTGAFQLATLTFGGSNVTAFTTLTNNITALSGTSTLDFVDGPSGAPVINLNATNSSFSANIIYNFSINAALEDTLTFQGNGTSTFNYSGNLSDGSLGTQAIFKNGNSALTLSGTNTFSGGLTLNGGTIYLNNASALGSGALTIAGGSTLGSTSATAVTLSTNNAQLWNADFTTAVNAAGGLNMGTGGVALGATRNITLGSGVVTIGGAIDDSGSGYGLNFVGVPNQSVGTMILNGANTYSGPTNVLAGTVQLGSLAALGTSTGKNLTIANGATVGANYALDQTTLNRITSGSAGTVALGANSGNNLDFSSAGTNTAVSLGSTVTGTGATYSGVLTPQGTTYRLGGGGGNLVFNSLLSGANNLLVGSGGTSGTVTLAQAGTYTGSTTVTGGSGNAPAVSVLQTNLTTSSTPFGTGPILLNNAALGFGTASGTLTAGQSMAVSNAGYNVTFQGLDAIRTNVGAGTSVSFTANSLTRSSLGGLLLITPSAAGKLGVSEFVYDANATTSVPLNAVNGMIAPNVLDSTTFNFLTYVPGTGAGSGFVDAATTTTYGANNVVKVSSDPGNAQLAYAFIDSNGSATSINDNITITGGGFIRTVGIQNDAGTYNFGATPGVVYIGTGTSNNQEIFNGTGGVTLASPVGTNQTVINTQGITGGVTVASGIWTFEPNPSGQEPFSTITPNAFNVLRGAVINNGNNTPLAMGSLSGDGLVTSNETNTPGAWNILINGLTSVGSTTFSGNVTSVNANFATNTLNLTKNGLSTQVFTGVNSDVGTTTVLGGALTYAQLASAATGTVSVSAGATLNLDNTQVNVNRLGDSSAIALSGANFNLIGNGAAATGETVGALSIGAGQTTITLAPGLGQSAALTFASLTQGTGETVLYRGTGLGSATGANTSQILFTTAPTITGSGTTSATILKGALGSTSATGTGTGFVTYGTTGVRLLNSTTEQATSYPSGSSTSNILLTSATSITGTQTNSLQIDNTSGSPYVITNTGTALNPTNGLLFTGTGSVTLTGGTFTGNSGDLVVLSTNSGGATITTALNNAVASGNIVFGGAGNLTLNSGTAMVAGISGTGGVYFNGTGTTTLAEGISAASNNILGGTVMLSTGGVLANKALNIAPGATLDINNVAASVDAVNTTSSASAGGVITNSGNTLTTLTIGAAGGGGTYNGTITGSLNLTKTGTGTTLLTGFNSYTGVTTITGTGILSVNNIANGGAKSGIGSSSNAATNLVLNGGTLQVSNAILQNSSTDRLFTLGTSGGTIDSSGGVAAGASAYGFSNTGLNFSNTGTITISGTGTRALTLQGSSTSVNNIFNPVLTDSTNGATNLIKTGAGTWVLAAANTYTGTTSIQNGTLVVSSLNNVSGGSGSSNLGAPTSTGSATISLGSTTTSGNLTYVGAGATTDRVINLAGTTGGGIITQSGTGLLKFTSNITATGAGSKNLTLQGSTVGTGELDGTIVDNSTTNRTTLVKSGTGTWTLVGSNSYTGGTTINAGTLIISSDANLGATLSGTTAAANITLAGGTLATTGSFALSSLKGITMTANSTIDVASGGTLTYGGVATGAFALTKTDTGTLILTGSNTFTGKTTVNGGTLQVGNGTSGSLAATSGLAVGGGTFNLVAATSGLTSQTVAGLTINAGASAIGNNINGGGGSLLAMGAITRVAGGTVDFTLPTGVQTATNGITTSTGSNTAKIIGGYATVGGTDWATKNGSGDIVANSTYTTLTSAGDATTTNNDILSAAGLTTLTGTVVANSLKFNTTGTLANGGNVITFGGTAGGLLVTANGGTISGAGIVGAGAANEFIVNTSGTNSLTIASQIVGAATAGGLTKSGSGTLVLSFANTYTGATNVNQGTLDLANTMAVQSSVVTVQPNGILAFDASAGSTNFIIGGLAGTGAVSLQNTVGTAVTLILGNGNVTQTTPNILTGSGGILKSGTGILTLSALSTYAGATTIDAGILNVTLLSNVNTTSSIGAGSVGGSAADLVLNGGTLQYTGTNTAASTNRLLTIGDSTGSGNIAILDSSSLTAADTLSFTGTGAVGFANTAAHTLMLTGINVGTPTLLNTFAPIIGDQSVGNATSLVKDGIGTWTVTGANTFTGGVTIKNGILSIGTLAASGSAQPLGESGTVTLAGSNGGVPGILQYTGGTDTLAQNVTVTKNFFGTISNTGNGVLTLAGVLSKDGSVLNLSGGKIVETGGITGASANSDLNIINGATVGLTTTNSYVGPTSISGNSSLLTGISGAIPSNSALTMGAMSDVGTNSLDLLGTAQTVTSLTVAYGSGAINQIISSNGSATTPASGTGSSSSAGVLTVNLAGGTTDTYTGLLGGTGASTNLNLTLAGSGTLVLTGSNTYSGGTTVNGGTVQVANGASLGSGLISLAGGTALQYTGGNGALSQNIALAGATGSVGTIINSGGGVLTLSGTIDKSNRTLLFNTGSIDITGKITGGTSADFNSDLTVSGSATLVTLDNTGNNYTGPTNINSGGTLKDGIGTAPAGTAINLGLSTEAAVTNTFDLNGNNQTVAAINSVSNSGSTNVNKITNNATGSGTSLLTLSGVNSDGAATNSTYGGTISDGSTAHTALAITGGTHAFSGASSYTGGTTISNATLVTTNTSGSAVGTGAFVLNSTGTLAGSGKIVTAANNTINGAVQVGYNGTANTTGSMTLATTGTTTFTGANLTFNLNGASPGQSNTLNVGSTSNVLFGAGTTLTLNLLNTTTTIDQTMYTLFSTTASGTGGLAGQSIFGGTGFTWDNSTGKISGLNFTIINGTAPAGFYNNSYLVFIGNGNGAYNIDVQVVPEPGTWALMLGGLALLVIYQRSRRTKNS